MFHRANHSAISIGVIPEFRGHIALAPTDTMSSIILVKLPTNFGSSLAYLPALTVSPFTTTMRVHDDLHLDRSH